VGRWFESSRGRQHHEIQKFFLSRTKYRESCCSIVRFLSSAEKDTINQILQKVSHCVNSGNRPTCVAKSHALGHALNDLFRTEKAKAEVAAETQGYGANDLFGEFQAEGEPGAVRLLQSAPTAKAVKCENVA
jgi:hypothetical protein